MSIKARTLTSGKTVWDVQVTVERRDDRGRLRKMTRTVPTKQEALRLEVRLKLEAEGGGARDSKRTVNDLMDAHLESGTWKQTTRYGYRVLIDREVRPALGTVRLDRLTACHLDQLYAGMRKRRLSGTSVRNVHARLSAALGQAVRWGWVPANVALLARPGPVGGNAGRIATGEEVRALLGAADEFLAFAIKLACATGMRRSELCALEWGDVNFEEATLTVSKALVDAGGRTTLEDTKTHATRLVPVGPTMLALLRARRGIGGRVLAVSPRALSARLDDLCKELGITGLGWHGFRHALGTALVGVTDLRTVGDILGHRDLRTTQGYVHGLAERSRAAVAALDELGGLLG